MNKKAFRIAENSSLSLELAASAGTPSPEGLYPALASRFQTIVRDKDRGRRCPYRRLSEHPALLLQHRHLDECLMDCHLSGGLGGGGKVTA